MAVVDGQERFDGCTSSHGHFICYQCNSVTDIDFPLDEPGFISHIKNAHQSHVGHVEKIDCTAYGICYACLQKKETTIQ